MRSRALFAVLGAAVLLTGLAACGSGSQSAHSVDAMPGMSHGMADGPTGGMAGGEPMAMGDGLAAADRGFTFAPVSAALGTDGFAFRILGPDGRPVTEFEPDQTKLMHFYLVRSDLTGFQHVHPAMAADGTWTAPLRPAAPGEYRAYASFVTKGPDGQTAALVLSRPVRSPGAPDPDQPLPPPAGTATVDGYTVTVDTRQLMAGHGMPLKVSISRAGVPVTDLQPYLETYAHLTAFRAGNQAMAHLHPDGPVATTGTGGPDLTFEASLPRSGDWRLFLQFQAGGELHTAAVTMRVG